MLEVEPGGFPTYFALIAQGALHTPVVFRGVGVDPAQTWCHPVMQWRNVIEERLGGTLIHTLNFSPAANTFFHPLAAFREFPDDEDAKQNEALTSGEINLDAADVQKVRTKRRKLGNSADSKPCPEANADDPCFLDLRASDVKQQGGILLSKSNPPQSDVHQRLELVRHPNKMGEFEPQVRLLRFEEFVLSQTPCYARWALKCDKSRPLHSGPIPPALLPDVSPPPFASPLLVDIVVRMGVGQYSYPAHQDWADNVLLQLSGTKIIHFHSPHTPHAIVIGLHVNDGADDGVDGCLASKVVMEEGDLVFIPKNWWHAVFSPSKFNLSVNYFFA